MSTYVLFKILNLTWDGVLTLWYCNFFLNWTECFSHRRSHSNTCVIGYFSGCRFKPEENTPKKTVYVTHSYTVMDGSEQRMLILHFLRKKESELEMRKQEISSVVPSSRSLNRRYIYTMWLCAFIHAAYMQTQGFLSTCHLMFFCARCCHQYQTLPGVSFLTAELLTG